MSEKKLPSPRNIFPSVIIHPGYQDAKVVIRDDNTGEEYEDAHFIAYKGYWFFGWWINLGIEAEGDSGDTVQLWATRMYNWHLTRPGQEAWQVRTYMGQNPYNIFVDW